MKHPQLRLSSFSLKIFFASKTYLHLITGILLASSLRLGMLSASEERKAILDMGWMEKACKESNSSPIGPIDNRSPNHPFNQNITQSGGNATSAYATTTDIALPNKFTRIMFKIFAPKEKYSDEALQLVSEFLSQRTDHSKRLQRSATKVSGFQQSSDQRGDQNIKELNANDIKELLTLELFRQIFSNVISDKYRVNQELILYSDFLKYVTEIYLNNNAKNHSNPLSEYGIWAIADTFNNHKRLLINGPLFADFHNVVSATYSICYIFDNLNDRPTVKTEYVYFDHNDRHSILGPHVINTFFNLLLKNPWQKRKFFSTISQIDGCSNVQDTYFLFDSSFVGLPAKITNNISTRLAIWNVRPKCRMNMYIILLPNGTCILSFQDNPIGEGIFKKVYFGAIIYPDTTNHSLLLLTSDNIAASIASTTPSLSTPAVPNSSQLSSSISVSKISNVSSSSTNMLASSSVSSSALTSSSHALNSPVTSDQFTGGEFIAFYTSTNKSYMAQNYNEILKLNEIHNRISSIADSSSLQMMAQGSIFPPRYFGILANKDILYFGQKLYQDSLLSWSNARINSHDSSKHRDNHPLFSSEEKYQIATQLVTANILLDDAGYISWDTKPDNILINENNINQGLSMEGGISNRAYRNSSSESSSSGGFSSAEYNIFNVSQMKITAAFSDFGHVYDVRDKESVQYTGPDRFVDPSILFDGKHCRQINTTSSLISKDAAHKGEVYSLGMTLYSTLLNNSDSNNDRYVCLKKLYYLCNPQFDIHNYLKQLPNHRCSSNNPKRIYKQIISDYKKEFDAVDKNYNLQYTNENCLDRVILSMINPRPVKRPSLTDVRDNLNDCIIYGVIR